MMKKESNIEVKDIYNYNFNTYLVSVSNGSDDNFNGTWFLMDKKTRKARAFNPMENIDKFEAALKRPVKVDE